MFPGFLLSQLSRYPAATRGDALVEGAERHFAARQTGLYHSDIATARREFDGAIDAMLDASDQNPADRQAYERRMDEMVDAIHRFDLAGLGASDPCEEGRFDKAPLEDILQMTFPVDPKIKDRVRDQVAATVSQLPLSVNDAVLGYINYFSNRGHRTHGGGHAALRPLPPHDPAHPGRGGRAAGIDSPGAGRIGLHAARRLAGPPAACGSSWNGAASSTGLKQTPYTDDRMDPEKATRAAAHHLHDLYNEFGDWYLAMAAYNCGPEVVEKAVERTGYADFWELRARGVLPAETTNYVPIILAMTIMEKNAAEYGSGGHSDGPAARIRHRGDFGAHQPGAGFRYHRYAGLAELAELNPAILKGVAPADYALHVPKGTGNQLMAALQMVPPEHPRLLAHASRGRRGNAGFHRETIRCARRRYPVCQQFEIGRSAGRRPVGDSRHRSRSEARGPAHHFARWFAPRLGRPAAANHQDRLGRSGPQDARYRGPRTVVVADSRLNCTNTGYFAALGRISPHSYPLCHGILLKFAPSGLHYLTKEDNNVHKLNGR